MQDVVKDRVGQYLLQFYSSKSNDVLLDELKRLIRKKDDDYKLDIRFIERILESRGLVKEVKETYTYVANNKIIFKISLKGLINGYRPLFLKKNLSTVLFSFGGTLIYFSLFFVLYFLAPLSSMIHGIIFFVFITSVMYAIWIISEPILSCIILPIICLIIDTGSELLNGLSVFINDIIGTIKSSPLFYDKEVDKPLIAKRRKLESVDILIIEDIFNKDDLTEKQAQHYLDALLSVKNNISNNML